MAENRFKKSIENATENTAEKQLYNISENRIDKQIENTVDFISEKQVVKQVENMLDKIMQSGKKSRGGNHTIYLSADVGEALVKYAKKAKKSKSEMVDDILREVFGI